MVYVNMLNELSRRAYETKDQNEARLLQNYRRYGYMKDGKFHSRFEGGTATGWSLDKSGLITVGLDDKSEDGRLYRDMSKEEFYEAVKNKQYSLAAGYVEGKVKLARDGALSKDEREEVEETMKKAKARQDLIAGTTDETKRELLTKETKYLTDKYIADIARLDEIGGQIGKEAR
jgi:hypothetical protein